LYPAGLIACILGRLFNKPVIVEVGGYEVQRSKRWPNYGCNNSYKILIVKKVIENSKKVIVRFIFHKYVLQIIAGKDLSDKVVLLPPAINVDFFYQKNLDKKKLWALKKHLNLPENSKVVLFGPHISALYGAIEFLKAAVYLALKKSFPRNVFFVMLGNGPMYSVVKSLVSKRGLSNRILLLGKVPYNDMPYYYAISDVVCDLCHIGQGATSLEGMASGKAIIGFKTPKRLIIHGFNGFLIEPYNWKELAQYIELLVNNKALLGKLSDNAIMFAQKKSDLKKRIERFIAILSNVT